MIPALYAIADVHSTPRIVEVRRVSSSSSGRPVASLNWPDPRSFEAADPAFAAASLDPAVVRLLSALDAVGELCSVEQSVAVLVGIDEAGFSVEMLSDEQLATSLEKLPTNVAVVLPRQRRPDGDGTALALRGDNVVELGTLSDVLNALFSLEHVESSDDSLLERVGGSLYRQAMFEDGLPIGWENLARLGTGLLRALSTMSVQESERASEPSARAVLEWKLSFARDVARRHSGEPATLPVPSPALLASLDEGEPLGALAHVIQSVADGGPIRSGNEVKCAVRDVEDVLVELKEYRQAKGDVWRDDVVGRVKIAGATGRALAAAGCYQEAIEALTLAVNTWVELQRPDEASRALCELIRVKGLLGDTRWLEDCRTTFSTVFETCAPILTSRAYLQLALGRAWIQAGLERGVGELLDPQVEWSRAPSHVRSSRERWLANGARQFGAEQIADQAISRLSALDPCDQTYLAMLDTALSKGFEATALEIQTPLNELLALPTDGFEVARQLERLDPWTDAYERLTKRENIEKLVNEFRY